jgi:acyl-ACP thioesterase
VSGLPGEAVGGTRSITVPYRARFDECGLDGMVRSSALLRYAQDIAWIHSERLGFTREWYADRGLFWVVRAAELVVLEPLPLGRTITLTTEVIGFRRVWARRRTEGRLGDGTLALWGHTDWVLVDVERGLPGRLPPEFLARFDVPPQPFQPGRVALPPPPASPDAHQSQVRPSDIDPMGHVNNAAYLDYLEEALLAAGDDAAALTTGTPRRFRLEYLQPAAPGATLLGTSWPLPGGGGRAWQLADHDGTQLARGVVTADRG